MEWPRQVSRTWWPLGHNFIKVRSKPWSDLEDCLSDECLGVHLLNSTCVYTQFRKVFGEGVIFKTPCEYLGVTSDR